MRIVTIAALTLTLVMGTFAQRHAVDKVNPSNDGEFPGNRGAEEMVIYTQSHTEDYTGTNEWGAEAVVSGGVVVSVGSNNSEIPRRGFVVSGHGEACNWINQNLPLGTPVAHSDTEVWVDDSPSGQFAEIRWLIDDLRARLDALEVEGADAVRLSEIRPAIDEIDTQTMFSPGSALAEPLARMRELETDVWALELSLLATPEGEVRAAWHRLTARTPEEITQLVDALAEAHINAFLPETIYSSRSIYPDPTGLYREFDHFNGHDVLAQLVEECHAKGIEVHVWVHCFFIGAAGNLEETPYLAETHPDWLQQDREGRTASIDEPSYVWINPAIPEVRQALIAAYVAMVENYDIDGFQFDYIRYPASHDWSRGWDYSDFTRDVVMEELGFDICEIDRSTNPDEWNQWLAWRENQITSFVEEAAAAMRAINPDIVLSAAIFPDIDAAREIKGQNWVDWGRSGLIDVIMPMAYSSDPEYVANAVEEMDVLIPDRSRRVVGIGPYIGLSPRQIVEQIITARSAGATGECLFEWGSLDQREIDALANGPWREPTDPIWSE